MNTTQIFSDYTAFLNREDKTINGVSPQFAKDNTYWQEDNSTNTACWNCRFCSYCHYCHFCSDCHYCRFCSYCHFCRSCSDCSDCRDCRFCSSCHFCRSCSDCSDCSDCSNCSDCSEMKGENIQLEIPVIDNIHQKVYEAANIPNALDMRNWHTCDTTHCRAGWVVHLAGPAGYELEAQSDTEFAAMQIYKKSSPIPVPPYMFYTENEESLEDMQRCANEEKALLNK